MLAHCVMEGVHRTPLEWLLLARPWTLPLCLADRRSQLPCAADGAALGEESSAALQLLARQTEELRAAQRELREAQQRSAVLEDDNVQLQARVSGGCCACTFVRGLGPAVLLQELRNGAVAC